MDDPDSEREDPADSSTSLQVAMGFPVTASLGPVGPLLRQLYSRPEEEIQMLTKDLDGLCISLMDHSEAEEPSLSWMSEIRELCYDTKNYLDDDQFISKQDDDVQLTPQEKLEITQLKFNALKARAEHASKRFNKNRIDRQNINKANFFTAGGRHRLPVPMIDDGLMDTLANKLMGTAEEKSLKALSFVGLEGAGKTTLARRLYNHMGGEFQCRAFARVSPNPDMRMFLTSIFTQIQFKGFSAPACCLDAQDLITNIKTHLRDKRYMIIIDDIWSVSVWDIIRRAFPDGDRGSRIITTTQFEDVASACCGYQSKYIFEMESLKDSESRNLLFSMVLSSEDNVGCSEDFVRVSDGITSKCGGLPLLIVGIACLLPNPIELNLLQWKNIRDSLPSTVKNSEGLKEFVNFIYNNLSHELQTCLLYLAMYPEGYLISKEDLVKQWVVEGFTGEGQNKQEIAREYFDELVSRGMIQAVDMNYRGVLSCTLHHIVHDLIVKKSMEGNFIIGVDYFRSVTRLRVKARRLSVQFGGARSTRIPDIIMLSEVRSLAYFGFYGCAHFIDKCMLLRILTLHVWADATYDLSGISKLLPLRYLKIVCNMAVKLPDKIQALQYMETLEIDATVAAIPSDIGRLSRLSSLKIGVRVLSRQDICILQALPALLALSLHVWAEPVEMIRFDTGDFSVLKYFEFRCSVPWLKFEAGSMPHLQILNLCFNAHEADQLSIMPIGIEDLTGLEEITAEIWGTDTDVGSTFRTAIRNHPSNPRISVELVDCMNFYADTSQSMGTEEKEYMSKDHDKGEEEKTGDADRSTSMSPGSKRMSTLLGSSVPVRGAAKKPTLEIEIDGIKVKAHTFAYGPEKKMDGPEKMDIEDSRPSSPTNSQMSKRMDEHAPGRPKAPVALWSAGLDGNAASEADFSSGDPISVPWTDDNVNTKPEKTVKNISTREGTSMDNTTGPPKAMSLQLLEEITDGFSNYRKLGGGTYGDVYLLCPCITTDHKMLELLKEKLISYQLCITDNRSVAHLVTITTACDPEVGMSKSEPVRPRIKIIDYTEGLSVALSMDVHSTKHWILICHADGNVSIWNHQNQTRVMAINDKIREFRPRSTIRAAKFIEPLQAFVFGDTLGYIHVYSYEKVEKLQNFRGHADRVSSLAVHPSEPLVLSASGDGLIKLWNWEAGWQCIRTFEGHSGHVCQVKFNLQTAGNTFASCSLDSTIKMWNMDSPTPVASFKCNLECTFGLDYFCPGGALQYLVARSVSDGSAQIWDLQSNTCIKRISGLQKLGCNIAVVEGPSGRPILLTVSEDRTVAFCDSTTHRYENRVNFNLGFVMDFAYITMTKSLVILCMHGIALMEID